MAQGRRRTATAPAVLVEVVARAVARNTRPIGRALAAVRVRAFTAAVACTAAAHHHARSTPISSDPVSVGVAVVEIKRRAGDDSTSPAAALAASRVPRGGGADMLPGKRPSRASAAAVAPVPDDASVSGIRQLFASTAAAVTLVQAGLAVSRTRQLFVSTAAADHGAVRRAGGCSSRWVPTAGHGWFLGDRMKGRVSMEEDLWPYIKFRYAAVPSPLR
jgi:hypothetical protein